MASCPYCEAEISDAAKKCRFCGEWVKAVPVAHAPPLPRPASPPGTPRLAAAPPTASPQQVTVNVNHEDSVLFAVLTLLFYIFLFPVGLLLNLVGLVTGPKRGCFLSMLLVFVLLPILVTLILVAAGVPVIETIATALDGVF